MSLSDFAAIGSLVGVAAVLVSLVYLAIQVRQTEKNQRAALNQGYVNRVTDYLRWYAESPLNDLRVRVVKGDTAFTAEELQSLHMALRVTLLSAQDAYVQHKAGLADDMTFDNSMRNVRNGWLNQPVYRVLCRQQLPNIAPEFAAVLEKLLRETPMAQPNDLVALFQSDLAAEKAAIVRTGSQ